MNYDEQIEMAQNEIDALEMKILRLMEMQAQAGADLKNGDQVVIRRTDAIAIVDECYAKAENFHGDRCVEILVRCHTRSGKQHVLQRCEVEKI